MGDIVLQKCIRKAAIPLCLIHNLNKLVMAEGVFIIFHFICIESVVFHVVVSSFFVISGISSVFERLTDKCIYYRFLLFSESIEDVFNCLFFIVICAGFCPGGIILFRIFFFGFIRKSMFDCFTNCVSLFISKFVEH